MDIDVESLAGLGDGRAISQAPLDRLGAAVLVAEELRVRGDELLDRFVAQARGEGCSWAEIGATLGISKQAAHQRFLSAVEPGGGWPPNATRLVRRAMAGGQEDARRLGHDQLGTEHVLLGLLAQRGGVAAAALAALGVERAGVLARITEIVGAGPEGERECLGVAPGLKRALELARAHARALGQACMDSEHVLLALGDVDDSVAAEVLCDLGAPPEVVRVQLAGMLGIEPGQLRARSRRRRLRRSPARSRG